jgi:hypothetical protein
MSSAVQIVWVENSGRYPAGRAFRFNLFILALSADAN